LFVIVPIKASTTSTQGKKMNALLQNQIELFADHIRNLFAKNHKVNKFVNPPDLVEVEYSGKWAKIWRVIPNNPTIKNIYAFVALEDFDTNKALGFVREGDIHKPASYKAPAKTSRGSVYHVTFNDCCGPWGVKYLK
jgi:hypothetical protein